MTTKTHTAAMKKARRELAALDGADLSSTALALMETSRANTRDGLLHAARHNAQLGAKFWAAAGCVDAAERALAAVERLTARIEREEAEEAAAKRAA